jgi:hypothetical protein
LTSDAPPAGKVGTPGTPQAFTAVVVGPPPEPEAAEDDEVEEAEEDEDEAEELEDELWFAPQTASIPAGGEKVFTLTLHAHVTVTDWLPEAVLEFEKLQVPPGMISSSELIALKRCSAWPIAVVHLPLRRFRVEVRS